MGKFRRIQTNFSSGEWSPSMFGRIDLEKKYGGALKSCKNFIPRPQGGLISRTGTTYLGDTGLDGGTSLLVEFHPNADFSFCLEFSDQALRAIPSGHVVDGASNPIVTISGSTYLESELDDLRWDYENDSMIFTHPNHEPKRLRFNGMSESPIFDFANLEFTTHPFQKKDNSDLSIRAVEDTHYMKVISSSATEFNSIGNVEYIEFKFDGQWQLAKLAGFTGWGDTFKDGTNVPDPSGSVAYIKPVSKMVNDLNKASKTVVVNKEYLFDATPDPDGTNTENAIVTRTYPDLTPASVDYWWLRADAQVFTEEMVGAWVRFRSDYNKILRSDEFADNGIRWGRIIRRVGLEPHSTDFITSPVRSDILEGHTYQVLRKGAGFQFTSGAPVETPSKLKWDLAFIYTKEGESFQPTTDWWFDGTDSTTARKGYKSADLHPTEPSASGSGGTSDYFSSNTILEHQDTRVTFDVVVLDELVGAPVGNDTHDNKLMTLSGEITLTKEDSTYGDQLGHLGHIRSPEDFFYDVSTNPTGVRAGQYILARHDEDFVTYKVDTITSTKEAQVTVVDGDLPKDIDTDEIYDEGRTDNFRISAWWTGNWPYTVAYHESRVFFGGSPEFPEYLWGSKLEDEFDFRTVENDGKVLDTTGIAYPIKGKSFDRINWLDSGQVLNIGTQNAEWQMRPNQFQSPLTAVNLRILEQTQNGATLPPIKVNGILIFPNATGKRLVEYYFDFQQDKHVSRDLSVFSDHLLFKDPIVDICYQENPFEVIWMVTESGALYSLTYNRDQGVYAWAKHETNGRYKRCATFRSTTSTYGHDRVIFHIERDLPSGTKTYLEVADPLLTLYQDPIKKIGLTTMDSVARIWSSTLDNGEGTPGDPNEGGGNTPGTPTMILASPTWADPWNWQYAGSSNVVSVDKLTSSKMWWAETSNASDDDDVLYGDEFWGATASGTVDLGKATAGAWVAFDLNREFLINAFGLRKGILGVNDEVWIHSLTMYVARDTLGGGAFDNSSLSWSKVDEWDWTTKFAGVALADLAYGVETLASPVIGRYVKFQVAESWTDHGRGSETDFDFDRVDFEIAPINSDTNTERFTKTRAETTKKLFSMSSKGWSVNGDLTSPPESADKAWYNTGANLWSYHINGTDTNMNTLTSQLAPGEHAIVDYTGPAVTVSRIIQSGSWVSVNNHPTDVEVWLRKEGETGWTLHRNFDWRTTEYELPRWQTSNGIGTVERVSFEIPQARYIGIRLIGYNNGGGNLGWDISETYLMNEYETSEGDPDP